MHLWLLQEPHKWQIWTQFLPFCLNKTKFGMWDTNVAFPFFLRPKSKKKNERLSVFLHISHINTLLNLKKEENLFLTRINTWFISSTECGDTLIVRLVRELWKKHDFDKKHFKGTVICLGKIQNQEVCTVFI